MQTYETISSLQDLSRYGIETLTGEADALSYRILCDLTEQGAAIVAETYGLVNCGGLVNPFQPAWNSGVGSVMLSQEAWKDIGVIALFNAGHDVIFNTDVNGQLWGFRSASDFVRAEWSSNDAGNVYESQPAKFRHDSKHDQLLPWHQCYGKIQRYFATGSNPRQGSRSVHAMSNRVT